LGPTLTWFTPSSNDSDKGGKSLKCKEILSEEEVESPHILGLGSAAFTGSSSSKKDGATKSAEDDGSSGHEKTEEDPKEKILHLGQKQLKLPKPLAKKWKSLDFLRGILVVVS
jgi:hypothetical protein